MDGGERSALCLETQLKGDFTMWKVSSRGGAGEGQYILGLSSFPRKWRALLLLGCPWLKSR